VIEVKFAPVLGMDWPEHGVDKRTTVAQVNAMETSTLIDTFSSGRRGYEMALTSSPGPFSSRRRGKGVKSLRKTI
jgi:hypothetical protein